MSGGAALEWFVSYLTGRTQSVTIDHIMSTPTQLDCGVPQGSVLGPILFSLYTAPLINILQKYNVDYHLYADDTQIYIPITPTSKLESITTVESCAAEIKSWMSSNKLKLNGDKTEVMIIGPKVAKSKINVDKIEIDCSQIDIITSGSVRNLGVILDSELSMNDQVTQLCKSAHFHLRNISKIRHLLDTDSTKLLINSFFTSRLDYCNSLLTGIPSYQIARLQKLQNKAARIITRTKLTEHIQPVLKRLHWLPVEYRINFKVLCFVYKCKSGTAPAYIQELIHAHNPTRPLRSSSLSNYIVPRSRSGFAARSFSSCGPSLWNSLPQTIRTASSFSAFKRSLKTHLFTLAFPS